MSNSESMYKELSLFNNISNVSHRAWNRLITISNLKDQGRINDAKNYIEKIDETGQAAMGLLALAIQKKGLETVRAEINRNLEVEA
jgi:sensor histidine kinase regulating citrate/malate metabolism